MGKHFKREITDTTFTFDRDQAAIEAEARLDGIYVLRTSVDADTLDPAGIIESYKKNLANVERDFRIIKTDDLDLRPIHHRLDDRVTAHVLICLLACYLIWHLRKAWAPLTFTDEHPPHRDNPVTPARRSLHADTKAARNRTPTPTRYAASAAYSTTWPPSPATNPLPPLQHRDRQTHRPHPRPTPRLRPPQHPDPPNHRRVAKTAPHPHQRIPWSTQEFTV